MITASTTNAEIPRAQTSRSPAKNNGNEGTPSFVQAILSEAITCRASDIHVEPTADGYDLRFRVDGLLESVQAMNHETGIAVVGRLMVMAHLLTYRQDIPQEGRASIEARGQALSLRVSIMPTVQGLRAAVRLPAELIQPTALDDLGLPPSVLQGLNHFAASDSGMLLLTGPAGSGKTTTIYALLQQIARTTPGVSIVTLEDPVERTLPGITQIQVQPFGDLTYQRCLRSILRQDPQVLMLGEIRDADTASLAIQAALSGHRLISTLHAATAAGAISRLMEMGIEPYQITSAVWGVVAQRLLRRRALSPSRPEYSKDTPGEGRGEGYRGRIPVAELAQMDRPLSKQILARADATELQQTISAQPNFKPMTHAAQTLIDQNITDQPEVHRVLGTAFDGATP